MKGALRCESLTVLSSVAIPGTGSRLAAFLTSRFQAAMNMRGTFVTMAVSSMSQTIPRRLPGATTWTRVLTRPAPAASMTTSYQPAPNLPPRLARFVYCFRLYLCEFPIVTECVFLSRLRGIPSLYSVPLVFRRREIGRASCRERV